MSKIIHAAELGSAAVRFGIIRGTMTSVGNLQVVRASPGLAINITLYLRGRPSPDQIISSISTWPSSTVHIEDPKYTLVIRDECALSLKILWDGPHSCHVTTFRRGEWEARLLSSVRDSVPSF